MLTWNKDSGQEFQMLARFCRLLRGLWLQKTVKASQFQDQQISTVFSRLPVDFCTKNTTSCTYAQTMRFSGCRKTASSSKWRNPCSWQAAKRGLYEWKCHHQNGQLARADSTDGITNVGTTAEGASGDKGCCRCSSIKTTEELNRCLQLPGVESKDVLEEGWLCTPSRNVLAASGLAPESRLEVISALKSCLNSCK